MTSESPNGPIAGDSGQPLRIFLKTVLQSFRRAWQFHLAKAVRGAARWFGRAKWRMAVAGSLLGALCLYCLEFLKTDGIGSAACLMGDVVRATTGGGILAGKTPSAEVCQKLYESVQVGPLVVAAAVFSVSGLFLAQIAGGVMWSRLRQLSDHEDSARVLISGLSSLPSRMSQEARQALLRETKALFAGRSALYARLQVHRDSDERQKVELQAVEASLGTTIGPPVSNTILSWQQLVRAIEHHRATLEAVYILPSSQTLELWDSDAVPFIKALYPEAEIGTRDTAVKVGSAKGKLVVDLVRGPKGKPFGIERSDGIFRVDYESYDHVRAGLERGLDQALQDFENASWGNPRRRLTEDQICVDMTSGLKIFSVAAMIVTLNRDIRLSYVSNEGEVTVYDAEIGLAKVMSSNT